jgi:hypothetical protein
MSEVKDGCAKKLSGGLRPGCCYKLGEDLLVCVRLGGGDVSEEKRGRESFEHTILYDPTELGVGASRGLAIVQHLPWWVEVYPDGRLVHVADTGLVVADLEEVP